MITLNSCKKLLNYINSMSQPLGITYDMKRIYGSYIIVSSDNDQGVDFGDIKSCYYILLGIYDTWSKIAQGVIS